MLPYRIVSLAGLFIFVLLAWLISEDRGRVNKNVIAWGLVLYFLGVVLGIKSIISGTIASFMTACIAGVLI